MAGVALGTITGAVKAAADWPAYNNGYDSQRFSPLTQIMPQNATT